MANPITFKELLNHTTGKANATRQEFESAIASRGYKAGDVRKLGRAYERVSQSGNEYVLHPTKGFNVYDPENKQLTGSGKKKGNKAGFDLGDLIGLGGDVSLLAGALRNEVKGYNESKAPKTAEVKPESLTTLADENKISVNPDKDTRAMFGGPDSFVDKTPKSSEGKRANKVVATKPVKDFDLSDFIKAPEPKVDEGPKIIDSFFGEPQWDATKNARKQNVSSTESVLNNVLAGMHGTTNWTTDKLAGLAQFFGTPREEQALFEPAHLAAEKFEKERLARTNEDDNFGSVAGAIPGILASGRLWPFGKTRPGGNFAPAMKVATNKTFKGAKNLYEKYPLFGRTILKPSVTPVAKSTQKLLGQGARQMEASYPEDVMYHNLTDMLPNHKFGGRMSEYKDGGLIPDEINYPSLKFNDISELIPTEEGEILLSGRDGLKLTPDEINYSPLKFNDIGELIPTEEGEILLSGRKGLKLGSYGRGGGMKDLMLYGKDGIQFGIDDSLEVPTKGITGKPDVSLLDWKPDFGATQDERNPGSKITPEGNIGSGKKFDWSNIASGLTKYGIPAAYLGAEQNQIHNLRKLINPHLTAPELMVGAVRDLPHPDFSLPYQPGMEGSSLGEAQASGLSRAKFQRENQNQWELKNALNRQEQQNHVIDRLNQNAILKAQTGNQEAMIKAGNAMNEFGHLLQDRGQTAGSLFQNLDAGITGGQIAKDRNATLAATHIIENANSSPEDIAWAKEVLGINKPARKKGGKLGKAKTKFSYA